MCWQYVTKFFGGSSRRRSNAVNAASSPRPSVANVPQVSLDTLRNAKSAKSVKSAKSAKSAKSGVATAAANRSVPVNVGNQLASSVSSMDSEMRPSVPAASGGDNANPGSASGAVGNAHIERRSSWLGYFGFGRKKKSSNESL